MAMELAQIYAQRPAGSDAPMQVSHVLAGNEPDEFRRLFHGWQPWVLHEANYERNAEGARRLSLGRELEREGTLVTTRAQERRSMRLGSVATQRAHPLHLLPVSAQRSSI